MVAQFLAALVVSAVVVMALPRPTRRAVVRTAPSTRKHRQENR